MANEKNLTSRLGVEIKAAREQKGFTQKMLAKRIGISESQISRAENDILSVSASTLRKIVETGLGGELELAIKL